jgi:hypothetical protein
MKSSFKVTLIASLIGSAVGLWLWGSNAARSIWPEHPQLAAFFLTIIVTLVTQFAWSAHKPKA